MMLKCISLHQYDQVFVFFFVLVGARTHTLHREEYERETRSEVQASSASRATLSMFATSQIKKKMHLAKMGAAKKVRFMLNPNVR